MIRILFIFVLSLPPCLVSWYLYRTELNYISFYTGARDPRTQLLELVYQAFYQLNYLPGSEKLTLKNQSSATATWGGDLKLSQCSSNLLTLFPAPLSAKRPVRERRYLSLNSRFQQQQKRLHTSIIMNRVTESWALQGRDIHFQKGPAICYKKRPQNLSVMSQLTEKLRGRHSVVKNALSTDQEESRVYRYDVL